jgi:hypothetical protein
MRLGFNLIIFLALASFLAVIAAPVNRNSLEAKRQVDSGSPDFLQWVFWHERDKWTFSKIM